MHEEIVEQFFRPYQSPPKLLVSYLGPASVDGAKHTGAILALLVKRIRKAWPRVNIIFRGDGGYCRPRLLSAII